MAHFPFNLPQLLTPRGTPLAVVQHALRDLLTGAGQGTAQGPGWFDSSFDLSQGLEVRDAGDGGYDDWLAARASAERRAPAQRAGAATRHAAPHRHAGSAERVERADRADRIDEAEPLDLADLARLARPLSATPPASAVNAPQDDFSRFAIEGLALA